MPICSTIQPGSVYYFSDPRFSLDDPHYFIVINIDPLTDNVLLLLCAHSKVEQIKRIRSHLHPGTTIEIGHQTYNDFKQPSIIDCNNVFQKTIKELKEKFKNGELRIKKIMPIEIIEELREAVIESVMVERFIKDMLT